MKVPFLTCGVSNFRKFGEGKLKLISYENLLVHTIRNLKKIMGTKNIPIQFASLLQTVNYRLLIMWARMKHITGDRGSFFQKVGTF